MPPPPGRYRTGEFLGLSQPFCDADAARFIIVPVGYEKTTVPSRGKAGGAKAILDASKEISGLDEETFREWFRVGITTRFDASTESPADRLADELEAIAAELMVKGRRPIFIGGERAIALGPIRASAGRYQDLGVLQLSAHAALRQAVAGNRYASGAVMRRVAEFAPITQVGIRALAAEESDQADKGNVTTFFMHDLRAMNLKKELIPQLLQSLGSHIHLSIDMSCFDPSLVPGVAQPEPGGFDWPSLLELLRAVARERDIVAVDVTELTPLEDHFVSEAVAARLIYKVIGFIAQFQQLAELKA